MERTKEKDFLKDRILKDLQIILWGIVALLCAVCLVLECLPSEGSGITVKEPVEVSSALINKTQKNYTSAISGILYNPTDKPVKVDKVTVTVKGDDAGREVDLEGFVMPPRTEQELYFVWESMDSFSRVVRVTAMADGEATTLANHGYNTEQGPVIVLAILLAFAVLLTVRAAKGRYYLWQEQQMQ